MAKLVVQVLDASDLKPKDGQGSANPFVEVEFEGQKQRTQTKPKDLNPSWNETLVFITNNLPDLPNKTIHVTVYHDPRGGHGHHHNFLGRVIISGVSIPFSESEANVQRYPLDKRGLFSHIKGELALKVYAVIDESAFAAPPNQGGGATFESSEGTPLQEINPNKYFDEGIRREQSEKKKKEKEVRTFHSLGTAPAAPTPAPAPAPAPALAPAPAAALHLLIEKSDMRVSHFILKMHTNFNMSYIPKTLFWHHNIR